MKWFLDKYYRLLQVTIGLLMGLVMVPVGLQIISRYLDFVPRYIWTEEVARFCFVWIIMIGSAIAVRDNAHFDVDLFAEPKSRKQKGINQCIVHSVMLIFAFVFSWCGIQFAISGFEQRSEMWGINMLWIYMSFPFAGLSWTLFLVEKLQGDIKVILDASETNEQVGE